MTDVLKSRIDNESDTASYVQGAIARPVDRAVAKGAEPGHPELAADHRDATITRVADLSGESAPGHDSSSVETLDDQGHGAFVPSSLIPHNRG